MRLKTLKLVATSAVGLTFATVMVFLGPLYGYGAMMAGVNLWLHLLLPLASMASFVFWERGCRIPFANTLWAILPPALYAIGYIGNVVLNGVGTWPDKNDFYGFFTWGVWGAVVVAAVLFSTAWGLAVAMRRAGKAR